jgi:hypothetical protein
MLDNVNEVTVLDGARTVTGFIPGLRGNALGAGVEFLHGEATSQQERDELRRSGMRLSRSYSRSARRKLESLENRSSDNLTRFAVYAVGGALGGLLVNMMLAPFLAALPLGGLISGIIGMVAGGYLSGLVYDGLIAKNEQDAVSMAAQNYQKQRDRRGDGISREESFAQLMAALPEGVQRRYEDRLERAAGTRDFAQALQSKEGIRALRRMMADRDLEGLLRSYTHIPINPQNIDQHVADQYAELLNNRALDARSIILNPERVGAAASRFYMEQAVHDNAREGDGPAISPQQMASGRSPRPRQQEL